MPKITRPVEETMEPEVEEYMDAPESEEETPQANIAVEDLKPEQPLWTNGPTAAQALEWKDKYGDVYVTSVTTDYHVAWRTINRAEFKMVVKKIEEVVASGTISQTEAEMINEELVCQVCALFPTFSQKDFAGNLAGLPSILSQQILAASGFNSIDVVQL